jgi:hypothetical protein
LPPPPWRCASRGRRAPARSAGADGSARAHIGAPALHYGGGVVCTLAVPGPLPCRCTALRPTTHFKPDSVAATWDDRASCRRCAPCSPSRYGCGDGAAPLPIVAVAAQHRAPLTDREHLLPDRHHQSRTASTVPALTGVVSSPSAGSPRWQSAVARPPGYADAGRARPQASRPAPGTGTPTGATSRRCSPSPCRCSRQRQGALQRAVALQRRGAANSREAMLLRRALEIFPSTRLRRSALAMSTASRLGRRRAALVRADNAGRDCRISPEHLTAQLGLLHRASRWLRHARRRPS